MTLYLTFSGDAAGSGAGTMLLGSAVAWEAVRGWAAGLDAKLYPRLRELAEHGRTANTLELSVELEVAIEDHPVPTLGSEALATLTEAVGDGDEDETVTIDDGDENEATGDPEADAEPEPEPDLRP